MAAIPPSTRNTLQRFFTQSYPSLSTTLSSNLQNIRNSLATGEAKNDTTTNTNAETDASVVHDDHIVAISDHRQSDKWKRDKEERLKAKRLGKVMTLNRIERKLIKT
jgi:hypothetical protein